MSQQPGPWSGPGALSLFKKPLYIKLHEGILTVIIPLKKQTNLPVFEDGQRGIRRRSSINGFPFRPGLAVILAYPDSEILSISGRIGIGKQQYGVLNALAGKSIIDDPGVVSGVGQIHRLSTQPGPAL